MPKKRFNAEQIIVLLRQIEVLMSQGKTPAVACCEAGISQQSYYRWRKEYGELEVDQARQMKDLERRMFDRRRWVSGTIVNFVRRPVQAPDRKTQKMPLRTLRSFTRGTPRGLFGSIGLMAVHSWSVSS